MLETFSPLRAIHKMANAACRNEDWRRGSPQPSEPGGLSQRKTNGLETSFCRNALASHGEVVSRGVTSCAGMTASTIIVAQTRLGFLREGRSTSFQRLPVKEQTVQVEEGFARATVALTRARSLCIIMGPLDMKGLVGAATITGCLMYGAGHAFQSHVNFHLYDRTIVDSPSDTQFVIWLEENQRTAGRLPPLACIEALNDYSTQQYKVRRLHLIV